MCRLVSASRWPKRSKGATKLIKTNTIRPMSKMVLDHLQVAIVDEKATKKMISSELCQKFLIILYVTTAVTDYVLFEGNKYSIHVLTSKRSSFVSPSISQEKIEGPYLVDLQTGMLLKCIERYPLSGGQVEKLQWRTWCRQSRWLIGWHVPGRKKNSQLNSTIKVVQINQKHSTSTWYKNHGLGVQISEGWKLQF